MKITSVDEFYNKYCKGCTSHVCIGPDDPHAHGCSFIDHLDTVFIEIIPFQDEPLVKGALAMMKSCIHDHGSLSIAEYYDICDFHHVTDFDYKYGWFTLSKATIITNRNIGQNGNKYYTIHLPPAVRIDCSRSDLEKSTTEKNDAPQKNEQNDPVNHPEHYTAGGIECIDAIQAAISCQKDPISAWLTGQVIKYLWRWPLKNGAEDLNKAKWYLEKLIHQNEVKREE